MKSYIFIWTFSYIFIVPLTTNNNNQITKEITLIEGRNNIYGYIKDKADNISSVKESTIILDRQAPIVTNAVDNNPQENSLNIVITASDVNNSLEVSGIDKYCYARSDSDNVGDYTCNTLSTITISELQPGTSYDFWIYATDKALNGSPANRRQFTITTKEQKTSDKVINNATGQIQSSPVEGDTLRRFQGDASTVKNNYICFGTSDLNECTKTSPDKFMYRIMGVDVNTKQLKIIKKEVLDERYSWHSTIGDSYTWGVSGLKDRLNGAYFLTNTTTTYVPNENIPNTSTTWSNAIETHTWNYGDVNTYEDTATNILNAEQAAWANGSYKGTIGAKIGLMYLSDYYLSVSNDINCFNTSYTECINGWIFMGNNDTNAPEEGIEWTMSRKGGTSAWSINNQGCPFTGRYLYDMNAVRPVFYLIPNIKLEGNGSIGNPYRIVGLT